MPFSVVILSRSLSNLGPCVSAVLENEPGLPPKAIIVVDDDETGRILSFCRSNGLSRIAGIKPFVFARNSNLGMLSALLRIDGKPIREESEGVVLLNDDALLKSPGGFSLLAVSAKTHPEYGIIGVTTNVTGQVLQFQRNVGLREVPHIAFVGVYIPGVTIDRVGILDERYCLDYGVEDRDYCEAVTRAGLKVGVHDGCFVDHGSLTSSFRGDPTVPRSFQQNYALYKEKWGVTA
jgi:hypothetical protein